MDDFDLDLIEHRIAQLGVTDAAHFRGIPLRNITTNRKIHWSVRDSILFHAHLARHRLSPSNCETFKINELVTALGCDKSPELTQVLTPKIQASLSYRLQKLAKEGHVSLGDARSPARWMAHTTAWARPEWNGDTTPDPVHLDLRGGEIVTDVDVDVDVDMDADADADLPTPTDENMETVSDADMPSPWSAFTRSTREMPSTPLGVCRDETRSTTVWPDESPSVAVPQPPASAPSPSPPPPPPPPPPEPQGHGRHEAPRPPTTVFGLRSPPQTPSHLRVAVDPRLVMYYSTPASHRYRSAGAGVGAGAGAQQTSETPPPSAPDAPPPPPQQQQQQQQPRPRQHSVTHSVTHAAHRRQRFPRASAPRAMSPVATPRRLATSEAHIQRTLRDMEQADEGHDFPPPHTPSRRLRFERPQRDRDNNGHAAGQQHDERKHVLPELRRAEKALEVLSASYDNLPRLLEWDARAQWHAVVTGVGFQATLQTPEHGILRARLASTMRAVNHARQDVDAITGPLFGTAACGDVPLLLKQLPPAWWSMDAVDRQPPS